MSEWAVRFAESTDAEAFAAWVKENPQIDYADVQTALSKNNPTAMYFVVTKDGKPITFAPIYLQAVLAHLAFPLDADGRDKLRALQMLTDAVAGFAVQYGIRSIMTLSKEEYPVAKWALKHGFELESRQALILDINKQMESVEA